jgi:NADPH-dependent 2,4-dienoyl-CoA reductase/sulfur reductase-like enzyme
MAEACRMLGMDVTILEKFGSILGTMGNDVADVVEEHLRKHQFTS